MQDGTANGIMEIQLNTLKWKDACNKSTLFLNIDPLQKEFALISMKFDTFH